MSFVVTVAVLSFLTIFCDTTSAARLDFLRYFEAEQVETDKDFEYFKQKMTPEISAKNVTKEPVIFPKDAAYRLSYADYELTWHLFKLEHSRSYESAREEHKRFAVFMDNVKIIERHNWQFHNGLTTYWMDINQFSDWTTEERLAYLSGMTVNESITSGNSRSFIDGFTTTDVPSSIDWTKKGYVTGVKNQGSCGSCWSFGATGSLEGQWFRKTGNLISLSEQQLVDCSGNFGNNGCDGGLASNAFRYITSAGGIESEVDYPYTAKDGTCKFLKSKVKATMTGYIAVTPSGSETALMNAVGTVGPVSVSIAVTNQFMNYKGGIFIDNTCRQIDHAVLVVGYGSTGGQDYWIVKNSWGTKWGVVGYIYMARNRGNMCQIATRPVYPTV